jgi:choline kinase
LPNNVTVVISAAGIGSRMGLSVPKCLIEIGGKKVIHHQIESLNQVEEIVVVVGYKSREVIDSVFDLRKDAVICINHNYLTTGTAASLVLGAHVANKRVLSLDGDLLVRPNDLNRFLNSQTNQIGVVASYSETPVGVEIDNELKLATNLSFELKSVYEWSGLVNIDRKTAMNLGKGHVFEGLKRFLPMEYSEVDAIELDTPRDIELAREWLVQSWKI